MTLTEKLAALPPLISVDSWKEDGIGPLVVYAKDYNALLARNALLCEALRIMRENAEYWALRNKSPVMSEGDFKTWHALSYGSNAWLGAHAALAACEVKP